MTLPDAVFAPIGVVRTPFTERREAPRQPYAAGEAPGTIELLPDRRYEDALRDLDQWTHLWLVYWFHLNAHWRPTVLPPRSRHGRRGVFATRAPHRPNPIGLSVLRIVRVDGLRVEVLGVDMIDGSPVLDIKPYVPFADAVPAAGSGWIAADPEPAWDVAWSDLALAQLAWLDERAVALREPITAALALGPQPHAYRRIRRDGPRGALSLKDWRVEFTVDARALRVERIASGYRPAQLVSGEAPALHAAFAALGPPTGTRP
jgi:tRNA-Thr(GGU) m(6)t(6)A37 methyltransferase TsaA